MSGTALEGILRRDRQAVIAALGILTVLAWGYLLWLTGEMAMPEPAMSGMDMSGMDMGGVDMSRMALAMTPDVRPRAFTEFLLSFAMWAVMMTGMMVPSATPTILLHARVARQAEAQQKPFAATGWFATGYLLAWSAFSLLAAGLQAALHQAALLTPMLASSSDLVGGGLLIAAGLYQWSQLKYHCLTHCRAPLQFIQQHGGFKARPAASLWLGFRHGLYCVGCCGALMLLLFVGGVMNIIWIAGLSIVVLLEKAMSDGRNVSRLVGLALIIAGLVLIGQRLDLVA
jgi:predicted metal-binding membrane protein